MVVRMLFWLLVQRRRRERQREAAREREEERRRSRAMAGKQYIMCNAVEAAEAVAPFEFDITKKMVRNLYLPQNQTSTQKDTTPRVNLA